MSNDLRTGIGEPLTLFTASQAPWTVPVHQGCWVADGPFLHRSREGGLLMLWSSFGPFGYSQGVAKSSTGDLPGPWEHCEASIWEMDGGHGMIFQTFGQSLRLTLHHPDQTPYERPVVLAVEEVRGSLRIRPPLAPLRVVLRRFHRGGSRRRKVEFIVRFLLRHLGIVA